MTEFIRGRLDLTEPFTMGQLNLWFTVRSALLQLMHMRWQGCTLSRDEDISMLLLITPKTRLTDSTDGHDLRNFSRAWIDHCLASLSTVMFPLEELEFETALCFGLIGITVSQWMLIHADPR